MGERTEKMKYSLYFSSLEITKSLVFSQKSFKHIPHVVINL